MPSSSTGCALIAGTEVSMDDACIATARESWCGKVVVREMGEIGVSFGGEARVGSVIATIVDGEESVTCSKELCGTQPLRRVESEK